MWGCRHLSNLLFLGTSQTNIYSFIHVRRSPKELRMYKEYHIYAKNLLPLLETYVGKFGEKYERIESVLLANESVLLC